MRRKFRRLCTLSRRSFGIFVLLLLIFHFGIDYVGILFSSRRSLGILARRRSASHDDGRKDLIKDWLRLNKARVDWRAALSPCTGNMVWNKTKPGFEAHMQTSANKSYIESSIVRPAGEFSKIFVRTLTESGLQKSIGGDYWQVIFKGPTTVAATVFDHGNGSYEAMALLIEPGEYRVEILLHYSLCQGLKDPPDNWVSVGDYYGRHQPQGILNVYGANNDFIFEPLQHGESIIIDVLPKDDKNLQLSDLGSLPCDANCRTLWNGYGRWKDSQWLPYINPAWNDGNSIKLAPRSVTKRLQTLRIFGDSVGSKFYDSVSVQRLCKRIFQSCSLNFNWLYPLDGARIYENDDFDFRPNIVLDSIRKVLREPEMQSSESLFVFNIGLHYVVSLNFSTYQALIKDVIQVLQSREKELGSKANVIWKATTAIHTERARTKDVETAKMNEWWRFYTAQRVEVYDKFATSAMCEAGLEVLDVHHLTVAKASVDAVHYENRIFSFAEKLLERYALNNFKNSFQDVCNNHTSSFGK